MKGKTLKVGVISKEAYIQRTIEIAKGHLKPKKNDPKIWFESIKSLAQILSNENQELLLKIIQAKPTSITQLESITHRKKSNLSRTLKTLEKYGIVALEKHHGRITPKVLYTNFKVEFGIETVNKVA